VNLFNGPVGLVPLLERAVDALETIASELVTTRMDRHDAAAAAATEMGQRLMTLSEARRNIMCPNGKHRYDESGVCHDCNDVLDRTPPPVPTDAGEVFLEEPGQTSRRNFRRHAVGTFTRCPVCREWRNEHEVSVTGARDMENELPQCSGGVS